MTEEEKKQRTKHAIDVLLKNYSSLSRYKGIIGTGAGFKKKNNRYTDEICICIEVAKKIPVSELSKEDIIPSSMDDVSIDVVEIKKFVPYSLKIPLEKALQASQYRPLVGGSQVTNGIQDTNGNISVGTLGCIVHLPDKKHPFNALLSNYHVLYADNAGDGHIIGQPTTEKSDLVAHNTKGKKLGSDVDVAIAKLDDKIEGSNHVLTIGTLKGFNDAYVGMKVRKYGITTYYTEGQVIQVGVVIIDDNWYYTGLYIQQGYPKINPFGRFSDHGDSGSVIVDADNYIVGLLWGGDDKVPDTTFANDQRRLHQVEGKFEVPIPTAFQMQQIFSDSARLSKYGELLQKTEHGREFMKAFLDNLEEGTELNNHQRECMVAWQRNKGPAFISLKKNLDTDDPYMFRRTIDGVSIEDMFTNMLNLYKKHGSELMRKTLEKYGDEVLSYIKQSDSVEDIINLIVNKE